MTFDFQLSKIHQMTIDSVLLSMAARTLELIAWTKFCPMDHDEKHDIQRLRESKLGHDLTDIARFVEGQPVHAERARQAISDVCKLIFAGPYCGDSTPPKGFEQTDLGKLINEAYARMHIDAWFNGLLTPTQTAKYLNVSRQAVYNFIGDRKLTPIYLSGKTMLLTDQVAALKQQREQQKQEATQ